MLKPLTPWYHVRAYLARRFIREVTPQEAYPSVAQALHVASASVDTSDIYSLPLPGACQHLRADRYHTRGGYTVTLPQVYYYPDQNLILSPSREIIVPANHGRIRPEFLHWKPFLQRDALALPGLFTSLRSFRWSYYQTLIDQLPLLFVLRHAEALRDRKVRLIYAAPLTPAERYFVVPRLPPGVELYPVEIGRTYQLEQYLYASYLSHRYSGYLPAVYLEEFLRDFAPARPRRHDRLLYVSRARASKGRRVKNEKAVMAALAALGFERVVLEELPVQEQIELFYDAACVVAPHGAGLTNLLFSDDADVLELFAQPVVWPHYYFICKSRGLRYHYLCGTKKDRHANFSLDVEALVKQVAAFLA